MRLSEKIAIITGGGSGLGRAIAQLFAREGATLVLAGRRRARLEVTASDIVDAGGKATVVEADITKAIDAAALIRATIDKYGRLDILVNNAGAMLSRTSAVDCSPTEWQQTIEINLTGPYLCSKYAIPELIKTRGNVLFISSVFALIGGKKRAAYVAAKGGLLSLVRGMALDFAPNGVRFNAICPAYIETEMNQDLLGELRRTGEFDAVLKQHPLGSFGEPADVAYAAVYLASDEAKWITGVVLPVDGGMSIG
jgi:NAD(P)-dependent dehydrogenase (short-subunit alcohol dehydrogenase family)